MCVYFWGHRGNDTEKATKRQVSKLRCQSVTVEADRFTGGCFLVHNLAWNIRPMAYSKSPLAAAIPVFMKVSSKLFLSVVIAALAFVLFASPALPASKGDGHLTIKRSAHFGANLYLDIWIDGKRVQRLTRGHTYSGLLPAGTHEVRVATPTGFQPAMVNLVVEPGKSYQLTASWSAQRLVLR